jgi:UDP-N-acetylmuramyl pentapeptide phosphotransferase/UDP-N-acetylglucosamine-1-phosphate transferase
MWNLTLTFLWAFLVALFAVPSIIQVAYFKNLLDEPNHRTIHNASTPRLGGIAIFTGFMSSLMIFGDLNLGIQQLVAGTLLLFFIGVKDDIATVSAFKKFFIQVLATGIVMFLADIRITSFQGFLGIYELELGFSYVFTFLVIVGVTNAINLIDGMDGLAGSIVLLISLIFAGYFYYFDSPYAFVALAMAGGVMGFLRYNIHKARVFMGDTGSLVSGFILAVLAIQILEMQQIRSAPAIVVSIMILPIFDTLRVFSLRIFNGRSPFYADKNHLHHQLLTLGLSQTKVLSLLLIFNLIMFGFNYLNAEMGNNLLIAITMVAITGMMMVVQVMVKARRLNV